MQRHTKFVYSAALVVAAMLAASCSEDGSHPLGPDEFQPKDGMVLRGFGLLNTINITAPSTTTVINGARWTSIYPQVVGTGLIDPFLTIQNSPSEEGFNTDAKPLPLNTTRHHWTNKLPLNAIPVVEEVSAFWREIVFDANEAQNGQTAKFSIDRFDLWVCQDSNAPAYDETADFTANSSCTKVYDIPDVLLATSDNTKGSGKTLDYRILIPESVFGAAGAACAYNLLAPDCGYYVILHTTMGQYGGNYVTGSTFEEYATLNRLAGTTSLTLRKLVVNDNGGTAHASAWTLDAIGGSLSFSGNGSPATGTTATLGPNPVMPGMQYTLSESGGPTGYAASSWSCNGGTFVPPDKITVGTNENVTCTITNNDIAPTLTLAKVVVNDDDGIAIASAWTLTATGSGGFSGAGISEIGVATEASLGPTAVTAGVQYTLSESGGPSGYVAASSWSCTGGGTFSSTNKITLGLAENVVCSITNDDAPAQLSLVKQVTNNSGGNAHASAWTLTATGTSGGFSGSGLPATGATATVGPNEVTAGVQYTLSESGGPSGYTSTGIWSCTGGTFVSPDKITVTNGQSASCTIANDDSAAHLIVIKEVINTTSGTAVAGDFTMTIGGVTAVGGQTVTGTVSPGVNKTLSSVGSYTVTEGAHPGYDVSYSTDCNGTIALGQTKTCTVTNTEQPVQITSSISGLKFEDLNADGDKDIGEPVLQNWKIRLYEGATQIDEATTNASGAYSFTGLALGTYKVCEVLQADWNQSHPTSGATCSGLNEAPLGTTIVLGETAAEGANFGNYRNATITVRKWNDLNSDASKNGAEVYITWAADMHVFNAGLTTHLHSQIANAANGATFSVAPGTYTICESQISGWNQTAPGAGVSCAAHAGTAANGFSVTVTSNESVAREFGNVQPTAPAAFLVMDEDAIDNAPRYWTGGPFTPAGLLSFTALEVNDDVPHLAQRAPLRFFSSNIGTTIWLRSGEVGHEGWHAPRTIPSSWVSAGPTGDGLRNFLGDPGAAFPHNVGPGLGTGSDPEALLDKVPNVIPLRAEGLYGLIGRNVCALVFDGDVGINYGPIEGTLKGAKLGVVAFQVQDVVYLSGFSSTTLPRVKIQILNALTVCGGSVALYTTPPVPSTSSIPEDIRPNFAPDNVGYVP